MPKNSKDRTENGLGAEFASRRSVLAGAALAGMLLPVGAKAAMDEHHHHGGAKHQDLIDAGLACVARGEACTAHCVDLLGGGDTSLKDCLTTVLAMVPMCAILARYAAADAPRLKELAKVCIDVCEDCAAACKRHADKHEVCKACETSCEECIKACKALLTA